MRTVATLHGKHVSMRLLRANIDSVPDDAVVTIEGVGDTSRLLVQVPEQAERLPGVVEPCDDGVAATP